LIARALSKFSQDADAFHQADSQLRGEKLIRLRSLRG